MIHLFSASSQRAFLGTRSARGWASAALLGAMLWAPRAAASPDYPDVLQRELDMPCVPQCTLCHTSNPGRAGTARKDFVAALVVFDRQPEAIPGKLQKLEEADPPVDTDGDGMPDIDELRAGRDPNVDGEGDICAVDLRYGCGARFEPEGSVSRVGAVAALALLGVGLLARRRRMRPPV